jgi:hypothetical protein
LREVFTGYRDPELDDEDDDDEGSDTARQRRDDRASLPLDRGSNGTPAPAFNPDPGAGSGRSDEADIDPGAGPRRAAEVPLRPNDAQNPHNLPEPSLQQLKVAMYFIRSLFNATHENSGLPADVQERIDAPLAEEFNLDGADDLLSLRLYLATSSASRETYQSCCAAVMQHSPNISLLSYWQISERIKKWTGIHIVRRDMCVNSCVGFTAVYADCTVCPKCTQERWDESSGKRKPRKEFFSILLSPQIQARFAHPASARLMKAGITAVRDNLAAAEASGDGSVPLFHDVATGKALLDHFRHNDVGSHDVLVMWTYDGIQVYADKESDMWIGGWIFLNLPAGGESGRYKKVSMAPGLFVPGPKKPQVIESFLYPSYHHASALTRQGTKVFDADVRQTHLSKLHVVIAGADGPAMAGLDGSGGHKCAHGCRVNCPMAERLKPGSSTYYPALLLPDNYHEHDSTHPDQDPHRWATHTVSQDEYLVRLRRLLSARNQDEYERLRWDTGLVKPSIFLGFRDSNTTGVPGIFGLDTMHLWTNATDELVPLLRGVFECGRNDNVTDWPWSQHLRDFENYRIHGDRVERLGHCFPASWRRRRPRNPALKWNSGYKADEKLGYFFDLGPMLFRPPRLPLEYYEHFCKLCRCHEIDQSDTITPAELKELYDLVIEWCVDFERLYVQRKANRLHFVRPWVHTMLHIANEIVRLGPTVYYSQWTMERILGLLKDQLRLHSDPYTNLAMVGMRMCQVNALKTMLPELDDTEELPAGSSTLGHGYSLLHPKSRFEEILPDLEDAAVCAFMEISTGSAWERGRGYVKWGRLALPDRTVARSDWKESKREKEKVMRARMVEVSHQSIVC